MADSFIQLSPDSTGKKVDTRTAPDGDHREVQVIGSPTTADVAEADAANGLDVDVTRLPALPAGTNNIGDVDVLTLPAITGTVTANAGTNLNTSALALEAGGNLAAVAASLSVVDDWDETDRAKVNIIAGQVGVQGGSGTINALTQRVVLATDQPTVPVSLAAGGTTQYAEDTAHVSGDSVTLAGVVQQSADAALSSDGDRSVFQVDASGFAKVNVKASALPTGAATLAGQTQPGVDIGDVTVNNASGASAVNVQDGGNSLTVDGTVTVTGVATAANQATEIASLAAIDADTSAIQTAVQLIDDTVTVLGTDTYTEATSKGLTIGAVRRDADTTLVNTTNEFGPLQMDANGRLKVEAFSGETLPVSGTVTANPTAKVILSAGGSAASSGNNTLIAAGTNRLKVLAFSLTTSSTTAMTCIFQSGASGTELWRVIIQAPTGVSAGANLSTAIPGWLFATASATLLNLNLSSANAVHWSVSYYDEA